MYYIVYKYYMILLACERGKDKLLFTDEVSRPQMFTFCKCFSPGFRISFWAVIITGLQTGSGQTFCCYRSATNPLHVAICCV